VQHLLVAGCNRQLACQSPHSETTVESVRRVISQQFETHPYPTLKHISQFCFTQFLTHGGERSTQIHTPELGLIEKIVCTKWTLWCSAQVLCLLITRKLQLLCSMIIEYLNGL